MTFTEAIRVLNQYGRIARESWEGNFYLMINMCDTHQTIYECAHGDFLGPARLERDDLNALDWEEVSVQEFAPVPNPVFERTHREGV